MIRRLAPHVRTALITGETGTGKELVARALHHDRPAPRSAASSPSTARRSSRRCSRASCSATSAARSPARPSNKPGLFELADGGTLFLDEIGELPLVGAGQAAARAGARRGAARRLARAARVNVHVIAATNRDLRAEVAAGRFRSDLYYRLNVVEVRLPPLRDRREDIPYLTAAFVRETSERLQKPLTGLTPGAERLLGAAPWDGNVRELRNVIERACILADGEFITERELAVSMPCSMPRRRRPRRRGVARTQRASRDLLVNVEREHIQRALVRAQRQQEGRGADAGPEPPRAVSPARAAGPRRHHHAPRRGDRGAGDGARACTRRVTHGRCSGRGDLQRSRTHRRARRDALDPGRRRRDQRSRAGGALARQRAATTSRTAANADEALSSACTTRRPRWRCATSGCPATTGLWLAHQIRHDAPETAVIMATGVQDVGSAVTEPAAGRHRLPDQAVRPRPPARVGDARHRVAQAAARLAPMARGARRGDATPAAAAGATRCRRCASTIDSDAATRRLLSMLTLSGPRRLRARLSRRRAGGERRLRAAAAPTTWSSRSSAPRSCTISASWRCRKRVLRKPAPLTREEQDADPAASADRRRSDREVPYLSAAADLVRDAHERMDGLGYPQRPPRRRRRARRAHHRGRRRVRRDDPPARLPRRDQRHARRSSSSSAAPALQFDPPSSTLQAGRADR